MNSDKTFYFFLKKKERKSCSDVSIPHWFFLFSEGMLHFSLLAAKLAVYQSTFAHYQHH